MDDAEGDSRFPLNYGGYMAANRPKVSVHSAPHPPSQLTADNYPDEDEDDVEEDEEQEVDGGDFETNVDSRKNADDDDDDDDTDEDHSRSDSVDLQRHPKKRKLKSLLSSFEFAPRVPGPPPPSATKSAPKQFSGGRNTLTDWSERETFVLLEAWGERFVKRGRKSLRSEEWQEVAEKVSQESKTERTDSQCRNRLDTLKKKYKKEKASGGSGSNTKWVYFTKMDMLMAATPQQAGLSCVVDSGEHVFMNPTVYLNRANGLDEMRDSPGNTDSQEGDDDSDLLPPKRSRNSGDTGGRGSFRLLADSINKFSEIYEKIENGKRKQMMELEKMRMDFHRELELQKREILDRARDEIAKIREGDYEENDSTENISG